MQSRSAQKITGACTDSNFSDSQGEIRKIMKTPKRASAISIPMASAISLPLNHLTMARDTVTPAISVPQPKIMKPKLASIAVGGSSHPKTFLIPPVRPLIVS